MRLTGKVSRFGTVLLWENDSTLSSWIRSALLRLPGEGARERFFARVSQSTPSFALVHTTHKRPQNIGEFLQDKLEVYPLSTSLAGTF